MPRTKKITKKPAEKKKTVRKAKPKIEKPVVEKKEPVEVIEEIGEIGEIKEGDRYFEAVGRRKTAVARIRLFTKGDKEFLINNLPYDKYFSGLEMQQIASSALTKMKCFDKFRVVVIVRGGGLHAQSEAIRHGTSRALVVFNPDFRKRLKRAGFLTRDPRMRERKKFGLKRARRAPQWQKR